MQNILERAVGTTTRKELGSDGVKKRNLQKESSSTKRSVGPKSKSANSRRSRCNLTTRISHNIFVVIVAGRLTVSKIYPNL